MEALISIIHPSRQRADIARQTIELWLNNADDKSQIEYILSCDQNDPQLSRYKRISQDLGVKLHIAMNKSAIEAINRAARKSTGNIIIVVSDDFKCPEHWDTDLLKEVEGKDDFIVKTQDGIQDWIITLPVLDKIYYKRFGYVYPPHIKHLFADTWMTHVADLTDRKITSQILFEHQHYSTGKSIKDDINIRNDSTWKDGERKYREGVKNNFGLKQEDIKGELKCGDKLKKWLNLKS